MNGMMLPIELPHLLAYQKLPFHHRDPFDRSAWGYLPSFLGLVGEQSIQP